MPIQFNFNVCDNSPECSGKTVCPSGAIYWNADGINALGEKGVLCVDNSKCTSCGQCVGDEGCPVGAIIFAQTEDKLAELTKGTETDINKVKALFVERYGAEPIDENICITPAEIESRLGKDVTVIEEFAEWSIQCLLSSIPIDDILQAVRTLTGITFIKFLKCDCTESKSEEDTLPSLKVYKAGKLLVQVDGVYDNTQLEELKSALLSSLVK